MKTGSTCGGVTNNGAISVNAIEPTSVGEGVFAALARAKTLIEGQNFDSAIELYDEVLDADLQPALRSEVQTNLAAALCTLAQRQHVLESTALAQLDRARGLLVAALQYRQPTTAPRDWASSRANLALVHMARYRVAANEHDILSAHLALDGTEDALRRSGEAELLGWIKAIRDHLLEMRDRRRRKR